MLIKNCRSCNSKKLSKLFSLGKLSFTGKFAKNKKKNIPRAELGLVICKNCELVQLSKNFNLKYLYGSDYGYRIGINKTMTLHMKNIVKKAQSIVKIKKSEAVLDIASNDGTLLNFYKKGIFTAGIDPTINKFKNQYKNINLKIPKFFSKKEITRRTNKKFKVISALSVFYDIEKPHKFLSDVYNLLDNEGIFILEHADLQSIIKLKMFDTICHEHLEYYSQKVILNLLKKNNLILFDYSKNNINGGSTQYYIKKRNNVSINIKNKKIKKLLSTERKYRLNNISTYKSFFKNIQHTKSQLIKLLKKIKDEKKTIHGYGASTKGNVLLQYFGINNNFVDYISDRNPKKDGMFTPSTKIKIISESKSRQLKPDYYLVLPWHFKKEILTREKNIRKKGTKFIFPLPKLEVC